MNAEARIRELEAENRDLMMRLSAIKVITTNIMPICADKLQKIFAECEGCKGDGNTTNY